MNNSKIESKINAILASPEERKRYLELDSLLFKYEPDPDEPDPTEQDIIEDILRCRYLNLRNARLESIPSLVLELDHIEELDLRGNSLDGIPADIGKLKNLKSLDLSNNRLTSLPVEISELRELRELYLHNNPVEKLVPLLFHNAGGLKELYIHNLDIKRIPRSVYELSNLGSLSISGRVTHEIDFRRFNSLHSVDIHVDENEMFDLEELKKKYSDCGIFFSYGKDDHYC